MQSNSEHVTTILQIIIRSLDKKVVPEEEVSTLEIEAFCIFNNPIKTLKNHCNYYLFVKNFFFKKRKRKEKEFFFFFFSSSNRKRKKRRTHLPSFFFSSKKKKEFFAKDRQPIYRYVFIHARCLQGEDSRGKVANRNG